MDSYTLIVIDMQPYFKAAKNKRVQRHCQSEIRNAIKNDMPIVFVEYVGCGKTLPTLTGIVASAEYQKSYKISKDANDGSSKINRILKTKKLPQTHLRICGINTDCCVYETVEGLDAIMKRDCLIEVVERACWSDICHEEGIDDMLELSSRVSIV